MSVVDAEALKVLAAKWQKDVDSDKAYARWAFEEGRYEDRDFYKAKAEAVQECINELQDLIKEAK
jgi:hypothetical protein